MESFNDMPKMYSDEMPYEKRNKKYKYPETHELSGMKTDLIGADAHMVHNSNGIEAMFLLPKTKGKTGFIWDFLLG